MLANVICFDGLLLMKKIQAPDSISSLPSVKNTLYLDLIVVFCAPPGPIRTCSTVNKINHLESSFSHAHNADSRYINIAGYS